MTEYLHAGARQFGFMVRGLRLMQPKLQALNIPLFLLKGAPPGACCCTPGPTVASTPAAPVSYACAPLHGTRGLLCGIPIPRLG